MTFEKYGFRLRDRVVFNESMDPDGGVEMGQTGEVCHLDDAYGSGYIGVRWDIGNQKYHECDGSCDNHHGWYVPHDQIVLESSPNNELDADDIGDFLEGIV